MKDLILLNIARFNRIKRKPLREILTFMIKRSGQFLMHLRDRILMIFGEIRLGDKEFFDKLIFEDPALTKVKKAVEERDLERAKIEIVNHMRSRATPLFYFNRSEKEETIISLKKHFSQSKRRIVELAEEIVNHRFLLLGEKVDFEESIDWHFNVTNNRRWPLSFSPNIDYFSSNRLGDIKIPWELNRTQHFFILGKAYWYTGDEKYVEEFANQLLSWIKENPYKLGINWMEGIEVAIRLFSWIWAYYFFLDSKYFEEKAHFEFLKSVYMHTKFIERHLSDKWRINNNHLIAEAAGLVLIGVMFPEFEEGRIWRKKGINILERELNTQILSDGVTWEQSTGYHKFVTDLILLVVVLMMKNGMEVPEAVLLKLGQMVDFLNSATKSDGMIPLVGDDDQGRALKLDEACYEDARPTITSGSILFDRKNWSKTKSEEAFWLFGKKALTEKQPDAVRGSRLFRDSGLMVMRDGSKYLLFLAGPQNPKYLHSSHRHLDELSFVLSAYGLNFLVDPGTYTYYGDLKWRRYFQSRKAHNTVVVDDKDPVDIKEIFELPRCPVCKIEGFATADKFDWVKARYNGYNELSHVRQIFFAKPEYWIIVDLIEGEGKHTYDSYFHFNHGVETTLNEKDQSVTAKKLDSELKIVPLAFSKLQGEILEGGISPRYGEKFGADILRYRVRGYTPQLFVSIAYPYEAGEAFAKDVKVSQIDVYGMDGEALYETEATGIKLDFEGIEDYFVCTHIGEQHVRLKGLNGRKGKTLYLRRKMGRIIEEISF